MRDAKGRYLKGFSGHQDHGKKLKHVSDLAKTHTDAAIATLAEIMADKTADPSPRTRAAEALLNRAWGRPPEDLTFRVAADSGELKIRWLAEGEK